MEDSYVKTWLTGLSPRTQANYKKQFREVLEFLKMSPTEAISKRVKDLSSGDLTERQYFELKFREYKSQLEQTKPMIVALELF